MNLGRRLLEVVSMVTALSMIAVVQAAEKKITRAQVPPAVEKTVAAESQGATIRGFSIEVEGGQKIYEMRLMVSGHGRDVSMDERGQVLEVEEEVTLASLPPAVKDGLTKAAGTGILGKVESLTKKGQLVAYEAVVQSGKKHHEIQVGPEGKKLAHPE